MKFQLPEHSAYIKSLGFRNHTGTFDLTPTTSSMTITNWDDGTKHIVFGKLSVVLGITLADRRIFPAWFASFTTSPYLSHIA